jgi:hypothetical protein
MLLIITYLGCSEFEIPTFAVYAPLSKTKTSLLIAILHFLQFNYGFLPAIYLKKQHNTHTQHGQISDITGSSAWVDVKMVEIIESFFSVLEIFRSLTRAGHY